MFRIGIGHDTHRLSPGGPIRIGGIDIPHDYGLVGHSDADVLLHAVTDSLLGAAALGDIGEMFPDSDPANKGRDSTEMLKEAWRRVAAEGYEIENLDTIIFARSPKLSKYKLPIRQRLSELLDVDVQRVSVKAKTGERVGPIGRKEAVMAQSIVLLKSKS